jgi:hypothetical protein
MIWHHHTRDLYRDLRRRILAETEQYLNHALCNPRMGVRIPRVRAGCGFFSREFADTFWAQAFAEDRSA